MIRVTKVLMIILLLAGCSASSAKFDKVTTCDYTINGEDSTTHSYIEAYYYEGDLVLGTITQEMVYNTKTVAKLVYDQYKEKTDSTHGVEVSLDEKKVVITISYPNNADDGMFTDEIRKLTFQEIECITIIDRKVIAIDTEGLHYRIQERLRDLENVLPSYFIRINKSTLANEHRILRFDAIFNGGVDAVFQCGFRDYVSRRCFSEIRRRYEKI